MNRFLTLWEHITHVGAEETADVAERRRVILLNSVSAIAGTACIGNSVAGFIIDHAHPINIINLGGGFICLIIFYLNSIMNYNIAKILSFVCFIFYIFALAFFAGKKMGVEYILVVVSVVSVLQYEKLVNKILTAVICVSSFLLIKFMLNNHEVPYPTNALIENSFYFNIVVMFFMLNLTVILMNAEHNRYAEIIEETNKSVTDSIRYAKRIQTAIFANPQEISHSFPNSFLFFRPKDIVSGDFYWYGEVEGKKIIMAADCTGHGVPGAFMTVMGNNFLDEIVNEKKITAPDRILQELDRKIISTLQKQGSAEKREDGMDITILSIDEKHNTLSFAGAKNPLYYIQDNELKEIKGSKFPVGSSQFNTPKVFEKHEVPYQTNDIFYIFTDGYQDQFGGEDGKKYMTKNFRNFLFNISGKEFPFQEKSLESELNRWKGAFRQTDDILVIGIKMA
jgi:serine phosphatase RsbU (regulator of sigma subunit)